jgi:small ligand-binding sensory domain FIST
MRWVSTASIAPDLSVAVREASRAIHDELGTAQPDLIVAFVSEHHRAAYPQLPARIAAEFPSGVLLGCSAGGVIGGGHEIEGRPGLSLTVATLPGVDVVPFHLEMSDLPDSADRAARARAVGVSPASAPHFVLLPDPFTFDSERCLRALDEAYPAAQKIGGLASGGRQAGANALFLRSAVHRSGAVGVILSGDIEVETIVAQGCRPVGLPMFATKCQDQLIWELDGRAAVEVLREVYEQLDSADQVLARHSLFLGIVMSEHKAEYRQGDFLIRNLIGMDAERGMIAVGAHVRPNTVVQFHLRDAQTSAADLEHLLARARAGATSEPAGALLFSCLGRGTHLYGRPDHDTDTVRRHFGDVPLGGFFCNGEIGPVQGTTFLHGYTSAFGLLRPRRRV